MCCSGRSGGITQYFLTDKGHVYSTGWNGYGEGGVDIVAQLQIIKLDINKTVKEHML